MDALKIDLNADMGESTSLWPYEVENDFLLLHEVSSMNLACGFHAGDPTTMGLLIEKALSLNVAIGAHPSYPDRENFGRVSLKRELKAIYDDMLYQVGILQDLLRSRGAKIHHVKLHGALYNDAANNPELATTIIDAMESVDRDLILYGLSGSLLNKIAQGRGIKVAHEAFADRNYEPTGLLTPRSSAGALVINKEAVEERVVSMIKYQKVTAIDGSQIDLTADTICIHSDSPGALQLAKALNERFKNEGIERRAY